MPPANILGLSFDYHDSAAVLLREGTVVAAAQEERFSRRKNDAGFPAAAIDFCLRTGGIGKGDVDCVAYYEKPLLKFDRILKSTAASWPRSGKYFNMTLGSWLKDGKFLVPSRIRKHFGAPGPKVYCMRHHYSHGASAFFCSPFSEAAVLTMDGVGEYETMTISMGRENRIEKISHVDLPHSLGLVYSAFTAYLGFRVNEDEYKVMGMAGFGKPRFLDKVSSCFSLKEDGTFTVRQDYFNFLGALDVPYTDKLVALLGEEPRQPESLFAIARTEQNSGVAGIDAIVERSRFYADVAASIQRCVEDVMLRVAGSALRKTGAVNLCMAGGVALNSLANGRIKRELGCRLYVQPAAGDAGAALGAALGLYHGTFGAPRSFELENPYLGQEYGEEEILSDLRRSYTKSYRKFDGTGELLEHVASLLEGGAVVGWMQGRFEWGPRALGARSILANPCREDMQSVVNEKIKFREPFRPFAPVVPEERAAEYFELGEIHGRQDPEYFMLSVCSVREEKKGAIPAVTHVDGTARVQLVSRRTSPLFYGLIEAFGRRTGVPVLLNTSFNLRGEPIVNRPLDAVRTFEWSDMDYLVIGPYLIRKEI